MRCYFRFKAWRGTSNVSFALDKQIQATCTRWIAKDVLGDFSVGHGGTRRQYRSFCSKAEGGGQGRRRKRRRGVCQLRVAPRFANWDPLRWKCFRMPKKVSSGNSQYLSRPFQIKTKLARRGEPGWGLGTRSSMTNNSVHVYSEAENKIEEG